MADRDPINHRAVWSRGFHDGMRAAGLFEGVHMKQDRFNALMSGVSAIAKKVYEHIPIQEEWSVGQIHAEMSRAGKPIDRHVLDGCLNALANSGLIHQPMRGVYRRIKVKERELVTREPGAAPDNKLTKIAVPTFLGTEKPAAPAPSSTTLSPMDRINDLAKHAASIASQLQQLITNIETTAIEIEEQFADQDAGTQKLRQLQALLKSI